uniref:Uncharacterized protein n=1 Tax=Rhizophora mucronata TaxID=61149 RepID=A0A2P2Q5G2_RHIMU
MRSKTKDKRTMNGNRRRKPRIPLVPTTICNCKWRFCSRGFEYPTKGPSLPFSFCIFHFQLSSWHRHLG